MRLVVMVRFAVTRGPWWWVGVIFGILAAGEVCDLLGLI